MIWLLFRTGPQLHPKASGFSALGSVVAQTKINLVIFKRFFFLFYLQNQVPAFVGGSMGCLHCMFDFNVVQEIQSTENQDNVSHKCYLQ